MEIFILIVRFMYLNYIRQLLRADHSSRGVVGPVSVITKPRKGGHDPDSGRRVTKKNQIRQV